MIFTPDANEKMHGLICARTHLNRYSYCLCVCRLIWNELIRFNSINKNVLCSEPVTKVYNGV